MAEKSVIARDSYLADLYTRKSRFVDIDDANVRIKGYFDACCADNTSPRYTGLVLILGLESKQELARLRCDADKELASLINWACNVVEFGYERLLPMVRNPSGVIFALKNFGWNDGSQPTLILSADSLGVDKRLAQLAALQALRQAQAAIEDNNQSAIYTPSTFSDVSSAAINDVSADTLDDTD